MTKKDKRSGIPKGRIKKVNLPRQKAKGSSPPTNPTAQRREYGRLIGDISELLESARRASARAVNVFMTATYWEIGRRIVEFEQEGRRAIYGEELLDRLSADLVRRFGRGFGPTNLKLMRKFYLTHEDLEKGQTPSDLLFPKPAAQKGQTVSDLSHTKQSLLPFHETERNRLASRFPLPWSAYVRLLAVKNQHARRFYEVEALRGGWSVRQLGRQINSQFYERTALSRDKAAMLKKGAVARPEDTVTLEEEVKDPYILEFLGLKDEYSESDLENALIHRLEHFLLELGTDFCFVGRQKRIRIGDEWYRVDLLFFHRRLKCLVIIDLKLGKFTHADAGQMHTYLSYASGHWTNADENPPVGLILCAQKNEALARYALDNLRSKVLATEYITTLPDENLIARELEYTRRVLDDLITRKIGENKRVTKRT